VSGVGERAMFRAIWPITDETASWSELVADARPEVPLLAARAHARVCGPGRFSVAESCHVPGSGRVTASVLLYEAPAVAVDRRRGYWKTSA
jgi:hypothetical protein